MDGFEWDPNKAKSNAKKHRVTFDEAKTTFDDPRALTIYDPDHSDQEDRFITVGRSRAGRPERIRIISARRATFRETAAYLEGK